MKYLIVMFLVMFSACAVFAQAAAPTVNAWGIGSPQFDLVFNIVVMGFLGAILKKWNQFPDEAIPYALSIAGGLLYCAVTVWTKTNFMLGVISGWAAVGAHQHLKQLSNSNDDASKVTPQPLGKAAMILCLLGLSVGSQAQSTNTVASLTGQDGVLNTLQSYFVNNDPTFNGWGTNRITIYQAAAFANVNGVAGASSVGNTVGIEIPIHKYNLHLDAAADFEQLFGDVHGTKFGLGYDYSLHQVHLSAGADVDYVFTGNHVQLEPYVELIKMPTTLYGLAPFLRYGYPITKSPGSGKVYVGLCINLP